MFNSLSSVIKSKGGLWGGSTHKCNSHILLQGGRLLIRLGDSDIDYDKNFKYVILLFLFI